MDAYTTHGAFSWSELMTKDAAAATQFYGPLLGWTFDTMNMPHGAYHVIKVGDTPVGGIMGPAPDAPPMPPAWGCYVTVSDVDATAARVGALGGRVLVPPMDIPGVGRFTVIGDPQGAILNLITYAPRPG
ncbi:VOC family protein [Methylibium sp.]|uniref:VOC family protein n=1 Tax=Methylibium sp. TaxID=2067992 RepID=UPI003D0F9163